MTTTTMIVMLVSLMSVTFQPKDEPKEAKINAALLEKHRKSNQSGEVCCFWLSRRAAPAVVRAS
jgi:hypothetical protein